MAHFQKIQELLLPCLEKKLQTTKNFQHSACEKFSLENKNSAERKADFRVDKRDIALLIEALRVPLIFRCSQGTICDGTEALCIVLKRFAYPCRCSDMMPIFGRSLLELSLICNQVTDWIYNSSIGGTGYSGFLGRILIKVGRNTLTSLTSQAIVLIS